VPADQWRPDWAVHPGETLAEVLRERKMRQVQLAAATGYSAKHVNRIVRCADRITPRFAIALEEVLGVDARVWARLQADWDVWLERQRPAVGGWVDATRRDDGT